jgi:hypothetical protein
VLFCCASAVGDGFLAHAGLPCSVPRVVSALHYAVAWTDQHPLEWGDSAFPATFELPSWQFTLSHDRLEARPIGREFVDEQAARDAVEPLLDGWTSKVEVEQRLQMRFLFLHADIAYPEAGGHGHLELRGAVESAVGLEGTLSMLITRDEAPAPDPSWRDTPACRAARDYCLRPMRAGLRPAPDAAYWLVTHLEHWAGSRAAAAGRLNVSRSLLEELGKLSALERKVTRDGRALTPGERQYLAAGVEELVRRLHVVENSGQLEPLNKNLSTS